jgi:hypothetical protein
MTIPSNNTFYQWGYHDPSKDPVLPLSEEQKTIFERLISTPGGSVAVGYQLLPSGEGFEDASKYYNVALDQDVVDGKKPSSSGIISAPALYPHDPAQTGLRIDRGNHYFSSGNYTVWPSPSGQDRYSAYWWDVSGIYFTSDIYGGTYSAFPTLPEGNAASLILFDDLDHDAYFSTGEVKINESRKYLLWITGNNVDQFGILHNGRELEKIVKIPIGYSKRDKKYLYKDEERKYYYSHFSNADHDKVDKGFEDFQIFYTYIHYIPKLKNENQNTHDRVVNDLDDLNQIPFLSNAKSVYLYSVYGLDNFFVPILRAPSLPFPPSERGEEETKDQEYNTEEELKEKFEAVSGLLGL